MNLLVNLCLLIVSPQESVMTFMEYVENGPNTYVAIVADREGNELRRCNFAGKIEESYTQLEDGYLIYRMTTESDRHD